MSTLTTVMEWLLLILAMVALSWSIRRMIARQRIEAEIEAYGRAPGGEAVPDARTPFTLFVILIGLAMLVDLLL